MGHVTDEEILKLFYSVEEVSVTELERLKGRITASPLVDPSTRPSYARWEAAAHQPALGTGIGERDPSEGRGSRSLAARALRL